jgi:hypothetical protein
VVEARIFVNKIPIYGDQHKAYTIMSRLGNILPVIRSCWHGGVEAVGAWTQRGACSVNAPRQQALIISMLRRV